MAFGNSKLTARAKLRDRLATYFISVGGVAVIATVVAILVLILSVAMPLFGSPTATEALRMTSAVATDEVLAIGVGDYREVAFTIGSDGFAVFYELADKSERERIDLRPDEHTGKLREVQTWGNREYALIWEDARVTFVRIPIASVFDDEGHRTIQHRVVPGRTLPPPVEGDPLFTVARADSEGGSTRVDLLPDDRIKIAQTSIATDLFDNETIEEKTGLIQVGDSATFTELLLNEAGNTLYGGDARGKLYRWNLQNVEVSKLQDEVQALPIGVSISALNLVFGDVSLAVGGADGSLSTWFPVSKDESKVLTRIHDFDRQGGEIIRIVPSRRNKSLLSVDTNGIAALVYMTSERQLLTLSDSYPLVHFAISGKGDTIGALAANDEFIVYDVHAPHPETSWKTLFGKVWYENYDEADQVWQSSAASDDYEPKLSLTPLLFGSFKGTVYAMLFAVPLALLGAIYTSQFLAPSVRSVVKPTIEIMASIPSVVIGFLIALWLAPLLEQHVVSFFLSLLLLPIMFVPMMMLYMKIAGTSFAKRIERGYEFICALPFLMAGAYLAYVIGPFVEGLLFDGNFQLWLFESADQRYDQRNAIIIAVGLGFAAIPIIFTISEDALSNVPPGLRAASLALGASRWQTVWRVILPSASPGIFAGVIIGFGRVIGETMIVLMATGNTPIMEWSAFNGMRTLSANIAVEIPEAPVGGTLYRVLFLSAVLLFSLTFVLNTAAELIRQRLREKYGRFQ